MTPDGLSIVIPTHRRPDLVRKLLESVREDSANVTFPVEVLLVDDTPKDEYGLLDLYAEQFGARILTGESHVGAKRNRGAKEARYEYILFLDSDVVIQKGTLAAHYHALAEGGQKRVGGCLGLVVFVGKRTFAWDVISAMQLTLPFSYPLVAEVVPWGPTANLSFRRSAFDDVGGFDLGLPRYGGEDVDIGLRMSKAGYLIATTKDAVAEHTIETWSSWRQNFERLYRFGKADFHLLMRHPDRVFLDFPTGPILWVLQFIICTVVGVSRGWDLSFRLGSGMVIGIVAYHVVYAWGKKGAEGRFSVHLLGPIVFDLMDMAKIIESIRHRHWRFIFCRLKFLDDLISQDWDEISASAWGLTASALIFFGISLFFLTRS